MDNSTAGAFARAPHLLSRRCSNDFVERSQLVRRFVLVSISDDYENVDQVVLCQVAEDGAKCGLTIERADVVEALTRLIQDGLAKAYRLSCTEPALELQGMPPLDVIEEYFETYFLITQRGLDFHRSDCTWWPFDDEGELRPGWCLDPPQT